MINEYACRVNVVSAQPTVRNQGFRFNNHTVRRHGHQWVEVSRGRAKSKIAKSISRICMQKRYVSPQGRFDQIGFAAMFACLLTVSQFCANANIAKHAAQTGSTGAYTLCQNA